MTASTYMDIWLEQQSGGVSRQPLPWLVHGGHLMGQFCNMMKRHMHDLESSINVQQKLLPEQPYVMDGAEIAVRYLPMLGVSGDYYDFLPLHENQAALAIGDVCGKGMRAAQLMASMCAALRTQVYAGMTTADELLGYLNRDMYRYTSRSQFVTLLYGVWNSSARTFTYSNAGHPPVLHYQAATGTVDELDVRSIVLGVCDEIDYPIESVSLEAGDTLVLYTDGIIETSDASGKVFGIQRLSQVVEEYGEDQSEVLAAAILSAASQFGCQGWRDDVTLVVIKSVDA